MTKEELKTEALKLIMRFNERNLEAFDKMIEGITDEELSAFNSDGAALQTAMLETLISWHKPYVERFTHGDSFYRSYSKIQDFMSNKYFDTCCHRN